MLFAPTKLKYKKYQKGKFFNTVKSRSTIFRLKFGCVGLKAIAFGKLNLKHLLTFKKTVGKVLKKKGRFLLTPFPNIPITKKPIEVRMGKGKGAVDHWIFKVNPGILLCEVDVDSNFLGLAIRALKLIQMRLPILTKIVFY